MAFCSACGGPQVSGARFCSSCGASLGVTVPRSPTTLPWIIAGVAAVALVLIAVPRFLQPPAEAPIAPPPPPTLTQEQTVEKYYADLNARRFHEAYSAFGPGWRSQLNYDRWVANYDSTMSQTATVTKATGGRYDVDLVAVDRTAAGPLTSRFAGSWKVIGDRNGGFLLEDPDFSKVTSTYFDPRHLHADSISATYAKIKQSLAFVVAGSEYGPTQAGTAFCISSNATTSYFLTNHHVVADAAVLRMMLVSRGKQLYDARVVNVDSSNDAAVIAVGVGATPVVVLAEGGEQEGGRIGVAGYPVIQVELAMANLGLTPSLHEGSVNALVGDGRYIEFDAQTDHGNSGGPLFDSATGLVYGMVTYGIQSPMSYAVQDNLALPMSQLLDFIRTAGINPTVAPAT